MANDAASRISTWFAEHEDEDGDFVRPPVTHPYSVTAPSPAARCLLYTTKPARVSYAFEQGGDVASIQLVGRGGLPNEGVAEWLRMLAGGRPVLYLGDCDPVDLLVFVWLRSQIPVSYIGVSDSLIERLDVQVEAWMTIPLAAAEKEAISLLTGLCPDYGEVIGPQCAALLARGRKLEIEAVIPGRYSLQGAIVEKDAP